MVPNGQLLDGGFQQHQVQHDVVLPSLLTPRHSGGVAGLDTVPQQQPPSQMPLQAYANYAMGPPQVGFSFRVEPPTVLYCYMFGVCSGVCFLLSGAMLDAVYILWGLNHWDLHHCMPLELTHGMHMCNLTMVISSTPGIHRVAAPSTALGKDEPPAIQSAVLLAIPTIW